MIFWLSIVKQTNTFPNEMIHIMPRCTMHLHDHQNKNGAPHESFYTCGS
jgi:hypothetical protein